MPWNMTYPLIWTEYLAHGGRRHRRSIALCHPGAIRVPGVRSRLAPRKTASHATRLEFSVHYTCGEAVGSMKNNRPWFIKQRCVQYETLKQWEQKTEVTYSNFLIKFWSLRQFMILVSIATRSMRSRKNICACLRETPAFKVLSRAQAWTHLISRP